MRVGMYNTFREVKKNFCFVFVVYTANNQDLIISTQVWAHRIIRIIFKLRQDARWPGVPVRGAWTTVKIAKKRKMTRYLEMTRQEAMRQVAHHSE